MKTILELGLEPKYLKLLNKDGLHGNKIKQCDS